MTTTIVTGGAGFVGSHVAEHFSRKHHDVIVLDNLSSPTTLRKSQRSDPYNWNYLKREHSNIKLCKIDLRNHPAVRDVATKPDIIIHTAGQVAVTSSLADPRTDFEINALGTLNMLEIARLCDSSFVFCSTNKVYGGNVNSIPVREESKRFVFDDKTYNYGIAEDFPVDHTGHSPYGCSKLAADIYVQDYAHTYGLKTGVFRMSCIFGERQFGIEDQGLVAWFVIATMTGHPITIYGSGKQVRDVLYVKDLVDAFDKFLTSKIKHSVFNIGGGASNTTSLLELLDLLRTLTGKQPQFSFTTWRPSDQRVYISDIRKAQEQLGWRPSVSLNEGLQRATKWVEQNRKLFE